MCSVVVRCLQLEVQPHGQYPISLIVSIFAESISIRFDFIDSPDSPFQAPLSFSFAAVTLQLFDGAKAFPLPPHSPPSFDFPLHIRISTVPFREMRNSSQTESE